MGKFMRIGLYFVHHWHSQFWGLGHSFGWAVKQCGNRRFCVVFKTRALAREYAAFKNNMSPSVCKRFAIGRDSITGEQGGEQ